MELATTLERQAVRTGVREVGINPNHWYAVEWTTQIKPGQVKAVTIWYTAIVLYRDADGQLHALDDACPHKGVALHKGLVVGQELVCSYHGWQFNGEGQCVKIPYWTEGQKMPCAKVRSYPVQEKYGLVWVFPGDSGLANDQPLPDIQEYAQPGWLDIPITVKFNAHFSICNENTMDVFHGFLHKKLQGWFDPVLLRLQSTDELISAEYQVSYQGRMATFLGLSDRADQVTTLPISIQYRYPHYQSLLKGVSSLYLMRLPIHATESRSFSLFFFKIRLPPWLLNLIKPLLQKVIEHFVLMKFVAQDAEMVESEQHNYLNNPMRHYVEINPAIIAVQRLILRQYEQYKQASHWAEVGGHKEPDRDVYDQ